MDNFWDKVWATTRTNLDRISPTMCLAKWTQATIHLATGTIHMCHHPIPHKIDLEHGLLDGPHLTKMRSKMLVGKRPAECDYCWNIEDNSELSSDRVQKSAAAWAWPHRDQIRQSTRAHPTYIELDVGHTCNFRCSYCGPEVSSSWLAEIKEHDGYPLSNNHMVHSLEWLTSHDRIPIPASDPNPYRDAFWEIFPTWYPNLHTFRITGGEPLLVPDTLAIMDYIIDHPNPDLDVIVNTNLCVPTANWEAWLEKLHKLQGVVKSVEVFTSLDNWGSRAAYIRHGLDWDTWYANLLSILELRWVFVGIMCNTNALSVPGMDTMLARIHDLKTQWQHTHRLFPLYVDFAYLRNPEHQSVRILTDDWIDTLADGATYISQHLRIDHGSGFEETELTRYQRIVDWARSPWGTTGDRTIARANFYRFFVEHDRRRGTCLLGVFPEFKNFWNLCHHA